MTTPSPSMGGITRCRVTMLAILVACWGRPLAGQEPRVGENIHRATVGIGREGGIGLLLLPTPSLLPPGAVAATVSIGARFHSGVQHTLFPTSLSFGFAKRMEAFGAFEGYRMTDRADESQWIFGMKANVLFLNEGAQELSILGRVHASGTMSDELSNGGTAVSGCVLVSSALFGRWSGYAEAGYIFTPLELSHDRGRAVGGVGVSLPWGEYGIGMAEISTNSPSAVGTGYSMRLGTKLFLLEHLQVTIAAENVQVAGSSAIGGVIGIGFSSSVLTNGSATSVPPPDLLPEPPPLEELSPEDTSASRDRQPESPRSLESARSPLWHMSMRDQASACTTPAIRGRHDGVRRLKTVTPIP